VQTPRTDYAIAFDENFNVSVYPQQIPTNHQVRTSSGRLADTPGRFTGDINDDIKLIVVCAYTRSGRVLFNHIIRRHAVVKTPLLAFEHPIRAACSPFTESPLLSTRHPEAERHNRLLRRRWIIDRHGIGDCARHQTRDPWTPFLRSDASLRCTDSSCKSPATVKGKMSDTSTRRLQLPRLAPNRSRDLSMLTTLQPNVSAKLLCVGLRSIGSNACSSAMSIA